jgi:hypothetical protein
MAAVPNEPMVRMFAEYHDLTEYQQELMVELVSSGKSLASEVKKPKAEVRAFLMEMVDQESIDVEQIMTAYRDWQHKVELQFEQTLAVAANLHSQLSKEQRVKLIQTIKQMSSKK